ncbi:MAG: DUF4143 domain-containing protein [Propionibacteriaceae bacterium]|nr:DUF4143 domain-containing protein [Propionibacteriaceae bacterium]
MISQALARAGAVQVVGPKWCGKTTTARQQAAETKYFQDADMRAFFERLGQEKPSLLLEGKRPLLLDEWQDIPQVWDAVRFAVDQAAAPGQFLLTGSTAPSEKALGQVRHSGTGRFAKVRMRTMSLYESGESTGDVSLAALFEGGEVSGSSRLDAAGAANAIVRGGWPSSVVLGEKGGERALDYLESLAEHDISMVDGVEKNPKRVRLLLRALARNESSQAAIATIQADMSVDDGHLAINTVNQYLNALRTLYVLEEQEAWPMSVRSKVAQRSKPVRRFCDPSLPAAALRLTADKLQVDYNTFGLFFESLAVRDLRVYAEAADAVVYHYRDARGLEADAIIERGDGKWGAVEVKLSARGQEDAQVTLPQIREDVCSQHGGPPAFLAVVTNEPLAYTDTEGIHHIPLGALAP